MASSSAVVLAEGEVQEPFNPHDTSHVLHMIYDLEDGIGLLLQFVFAGTFLLDAFGEAFDLLRPQCDFTRFLH